MRLCVSIFLLLRLAYVISRLGWLEPYLSLFQHPVLDFVVPHSKKIKRSTSIVLLGQRGRFVSLDLRDDANRDFNPFRKRTERSSQSV